MSFTSKMAIHVTGPGAGGPPKNYTLTAADETALMDQADHLAGLQKDLIGINRTNIKSGKKKGQIKVNIKVATTDDSDKSDHYSIELNYHGLEPSMLSDIQQAVAARLGNVGLTP